MRVIGALACLLVAACCASFPPNGAVLPVQKLFSAVDGRPLCTTFAIHPSGVWVTAAHCGADEPVLVGLAEAEVIAVDVERDVLVLRAALVPDTILPLGHAPAVGDETRISCYPPAFLASEAPGIFFGHVIHPSMAVPAAFTRERPVLVLHEGSGPGCSGAPVVSEGGVIGIVRGGIEVPSIVVVAVPFGDLVQVAGKYWG